MKPVESQIADWRGFVARGSVLDGGDVQELEAHLRDEIAALESSGLAADEAFLVAVKRIGSSDAVSHEFAREHSGRLWKQLGLAGDAEQARPSSGTSAALGLAVGAAVTVLVARLAAAFPGEESW
ncbi:MAG TPA: permease prefix domain 1-containing protein [Egibacteraceae bacterium]|nr:permease prefix domain 1-containing protein [Egibacteraceae bacterium]